MLSEHAKLRRHHEKNSGATTHKTPQLKMTTRHYRRLDLYACFIRVASITLSIKKFTALLGGEKQSTNQKLQGSAPGPSERSHHAMIIKLFTTLTYK